MKLQEYLQDHNLTHSDFQKEALKEDADISQGAIAKWVLDKRIPRREDMQAIFKVTNGKVTPMDFYDLPLINQI